MTRTQAIVLAGRPQGGPVQPSHFASREIDLPELADGQVRVAVTHLALDPFVRGLMDERRTSADAMGGFSAAMAIGDVIRGEGVGRIVASRAPALREGDMVVGHFGWTDQAVADAARLHAVCADVDPSWHLAGLGISGQTAYFGLDAATPQAGETVLVSSAAGAIGSLVGQIARLRGLDAVGLAGGTEKGRWLVAERGFAAALDYRGKDRQALAAELAALRPNGVNIFFDNVGGTVLDAGMASMAARGRIIICGTISQYDRMDAEELAPRWNRRVLSLGLSIKGFNVFDAQSERERFEAEMRQWLVNGDIRQDIHQVKGFAAAPAALIALLAGELRGKVVVAL
jgi:NADPH-dependent curcumin reductase CurA